MKNPDKETRIIAIADKEKLAGNLFGGLTVNANGSIRVGKTDIHPYEIGPALAKAVMAMNDYVETKSEGSLSGDRIMLLMVEPDDAQSSKLSDLEKLTKWLFTSPDSLDIRMELLETIVTTLRQNSFVQQ